MDFTFSTEQEQLRDTLRRFLAARYGWAERLAAARQDEGWRREIWHAFAAELGILGLGIPESLGGSGGGAVERMIVLEELGRALSLEPFIETNVLAATALTADNGPRARALLEEMVAGRAIVAFAWAEPGSRYGIAGTTTRATRDSGGWRLDGAKAAVTAAPGADHLLVLARTGGAAGEMDGLSLFLVDAAAGGVALSSYPTIDGRRAADVVFTAVVLLGDALVGEEGAAAALAERMIDHGIAALVAEGTGVATRALDDTRAYLAERRQFGQPLSRFQVVQHRLVDMFVQLEVARSAAYLATLRLDDAPDVRAAACSSAKVATDRAMRFIGQNAVQLHGGMGMTDDLAVGHCFKRMTMIEGEFGTVDHHLARYARLRRAA